MRLRLDLLDDRSPDGLEVVQITTEPGVPSCHVYMEAQVFTPDSRRFVLHRSSHAHGSDPRDPEHRYLLCDLDDGCSLAPLTTEAGATAPSVSPDGAWLFYLVDETKLDAGRLTLKRVRLDGTDRETLVVIDAPVRGSTCRPSQPYCLSTISSDGKRLATAAYLGDGGTEHAPFGLLVFDLETGDAWVPLSGPTWCNLHPQYSRSQYSPANRDILVQENHGNECDSRGDVVHLVGGAGADIHVVRDDGSHFRNMPWGRDGNEHCQGHQCWRGRGERAITSTGTDQPEEAQLIEGAAAPYAGHVGIATPGGRRNDLSRNFPTPRFFHFATDIAGTRLITDYRFDDGPDALYVAELPDAEDEPVREFRYLLSPRCSWRKDNHVHPFLSPDGRTGFFNSDESGVLQAYMVRGW
jgi:hypothetical protein